ncbi:hypothetical protein VP01_3447g3 [Puccinia sorghi]|uniref:Uncharacterized protein n=1 Tax=Puccinia sorghi TaxID=27349 RepID=A0A0L6UY46_9BASI|nr:hypothetical protein VP01_3447g3 [Puccinia sorghi]
MRSGYSLQFILMRLKTAKSATTNTEHITLHAATHSGLDAFFCLSIDWLLLLLENHLSFLTLMLLIHLSNVDKHRHRGFFWTYGGLGKENCKGINMQPLKNPHKSDTCFSCPSALYVGYLAAMSLPPLTTQGHQLLDSAWFCIGNSLKIKPLAFGCIIIYAKREELMQVVAFQIKYHDLLREIAQIERSPSTTAPASDTNSKPFDLHFSNQLEERRRLGKGISIYPFHHVSVPCQSNPHQQNDPPSRTETYMFKLSIFNKSGNLMTPPLPTPHSRTFHTTFPSNVTPLSRLAHFLPWKIKSFPLGHFKCFKHIILSSSYTILKNTISNHQSMNACMSQSDQTRHTQPIPLSVSAPGVYSSPVSPLQNNNIHETQELVQAFSCKISFYVFISLFPRFESCCPAMRVPNSNVDAKSFC